MRTVNGKWKLSFCFSCRKQKILSMMTLNELALLNGHIAQSGLRQMPCAHLLMDALCCYKNGIMQFVSRLSNHLDHRASFNGSHEIIVTIFLIHFQFSTNKMVKLGFQHWIQKVIISMINHVKLPQETQDIISLSIKWPSETMLAQGISR